jgi:hypothetical protein
MGCALIRERELPRIDGYAARRVRFLVKDERHRGGLALAKLGGVTAAYAPARRRIT